MAWTEYAHAKKGDVVFVSAGAGSVGSFVLVLAVIISFIDHRCRMVIQLAKQQGLKVIGSAGSDDKVEYMKKIGADVAFNYKTSNTADVLSSEGPINM